MRGRDAKPERRKVLCRRRWIKKSPTGTEAAGESTGFSQLSVSFSSSHEHIIVSAPLLHQHLLSRLDDPASESLFTPFITSCRLRQQTADWLRAKAEQSASVWDVTKEEQNNVFVKKEMVKIYPVNPVCQVFMQTCRICAASSFSWSRFDASNCLQMTVNTGSLVFRDFIDEILRSINEIIIAGSWFTLFPRGFQPVNAALWWYLFHWGCSLMMKGRPDVLAVLSRRFHYRPDPTASGCL